MSESSKHSSSTFTDWNGVMAELFELDTIYTVESPHDSSSGIASDGPNYPNTLTTFKDVDTDSDPYTTHAEIHAEPYESQERNWDLYEYGISNSCNQQNQPDVRKKVPKGMFSLPQQHLFTNGIPRTNNKLVYNPNKRHPSPPITTELQDTEKLLQGTKKKLRYSYFDFLPDDTIIKIFGNLPSDQLCRCCRVSRRWYNLVWDPTLWTCIKINNAQINVDRALKSLTKRLSYDTPKVCVMVEKVNLNGCEKLTDKGLHTLAKRCPELRQMELQGCCNISNIALFEIVSRCVNLEHLNVTGCECVTCICLTPEATVQATTYGKQIFLRYLDMTDCHALEDSGLQIIASYCSQLVYLYLRRCSLITDIGVQYVANYCANMREFSISDCHRVTDFGMRELSKLESNLRYLSCAKCEKVSDVGIKYIAKYCKKIRYLNVRGCEAVSDDSLELLARNCPRLKSLDIGKCDVSDEGLQMLAEHCPQLKKLSLKSCDAITDNGIIAVAYHCRSLQQLNIQDCHLTVEAYRTVKKCCKRCIIEHTNPGFC